ncbi:ATP synthase F1 subunit delta [Clostridium sp. MCC353]|uniref:ATP synthase F1 subunit delta n=1 Tax=Clostridium sp. MCC353 TaxID=2592646 RepID=UPI001C01C4F3|nr:ATP synthase F1 subunit delta [Clostridium sp. MCC353]MBT9777004.1 ATP synthase F1 subunit delta [Clostridium sp. MCC353]
MTQLSINYAKVLFELHLPAEDIGQSERIFAQVPELLDVFTSPVIRETKKMVLIDRIFPVTIRSFLKVMCQNHAMDGILDTFSEYKKYYCEEHKILPAVMTYSSRPDPEQIDGIKQFLCDKYKKDRVDLTLREDPKLIGGFVVRMGDREIDCSLRGRLKQLEQKLMWR